jgi:small ligand-binding sensory domain FIST
MPFAAALSTASPTAAALDEVCAQASASLGGLADLAVVFFSSHHVRHAADIAATIGQRLNPGAVFGCVAESVIGNDREVEGRPALSLWLAKWARPVAVHPFHLTLERTADGPSLMGWPDALLAAGGPAPLDPRAVRRSAVLLLGDPYTFPTDQFLARLNEDVPNVPVLGGMVSGTNGAGDCRLILGGRVLDQGAIGLFLEGEIGLRSIVSQGCRPIGRPMVVTRAEENVILELSGRTPFDQLRDLWADLPAADQRLFQNGLHIGRVLNEYQAEFQRGDFLVRNVMGLEKQSGALIITDHVRVGQTVQFQVRDAASADEDLHALLRMDVGAHDRRPAAALVFTCNGRGTRLFAAPDHDASAVRQEAGAIPVAGFFAQGELGPVGGENHIHGFTASVAIFEE